MKKMKLMLITLILLLINISVPVNHADPSITGQILYSSMLSLNTYLINNDGTIANTWHSNYLPGLSVYMLSNGNILRPIRLNLEQGGSGGVEEYTPTGELVWSYEYYSDNYQSHHDIAPLPNGNVLMLAWENKNETEVINAGRNPDFVNGPVQFEHIIEVQPTGSNMGIIVWQWHSFDHLIQDYDPGKENYGVVSDNPELLDINYGGTDADWLHCNSIDYNEDLDQILISCRNFNEIWIIDHSTTTTQAAGHTGGRYGKGGDILYRWGNPQAYKIDAPREFYEQHDATWIDLGCPGEGNIMVFNNGVGRGYSSVDEIIPPIDSSGFYNYVTGTAYAPTDPVWRYTSSGFYSFRFSSAQRLRSGNTLICDGVASKFFEVTSQMATVWQYNAPQVGGVFKIAYIYPQGQNIEDLYCSGSFSFSNVEPETTITSTFQVQNIGENNSLLNWTIDSYPDWGTWTFYPLSGNDLEVGYNIIVNASVLTPPGKWKKFTGTIKVKNLDNPDDFCEIDVILKTPSPFTKNGLNLLQWILQKHPKILPILQHIMRL